MLLGNKVAPGYHRLMAACPTCPDLPAVSRPRDAWGCPTGGVVLVSACLAGLFTRYDSRDAFNEDLMQRLSGVRWIPVCPEEAGGLPSPRPPAEMVGGDGHAVLRGRAKVMAAGGADVTLAFIAGAHAVLDVARRLQARACYLKSRSPSCGLRPSHGPAGRLGGIGVCAALLVEQGLRVIEV
ncbi:MAG: DUF523 domain-containing protein [Pseudomonadota bacterium]